MATQKLTDVVQQVTDKIKIDTLSASFVFPKTSSLSDDTPIITMELQTLDFQAIKDFVTSHPEAIALSVRDDLILILQVMQQVKDELLLDKFDCIQIYRGGLDILRITITSNKNGRSAIVEMNDYRRRLAQAIVAPWDKYPYTTGIFVSILSLVLVEGIKYALHKN